MRLSAYLPSCCCPSVPICRVSGENCRQHPECQSWQKTVYNSCWQGLGKARKRAAVQKLNSWMHNASEGVPCQDCFVRGNFMPKEAQRLQHGSVRVLKDLTGYQIVGSFAGIKLSSAGTVLRSAMS